MSEELDFELVEDSDDGQDESTNQANEDTTASDDKSKDSSEGNTTSAKSKKSNWKKMSKAMKEKDKKIASLESRLAKLESSSNDSDDDYEEEIDLEDNFDKNEFRFFLIENPEAKDYKNELQNQLDKYPDMSFEDALALVKAKTPKPSESSKDFSLKWSNVKVRKRLEDLTEDEALKLSNDKYLEWNRLKWYLK